MIRLRIFVLVAFLLLTKQYNLFSQEIPLGTWRTHFSYNSSTSVAVTENKIYSGSDNGFFYLEKDFNSFAIQSKINGFSDVSVRKLKYSLANKTLIVAYSNGDIDLLKEGKVTNIPTIKNANNTFDKTIHHILIHNSQAFLSTAFGVILLDLDKKEIKEVYQNIGPNGSVVEVHSSAIHNNYLYLATALGVMYGGIAPNINLQDFNNWQIFNSESAIPEGKIDAIVNFNNSLFAGINNQGIYQLNNSTWSRTDFPIAQSIKSMTVSSEKLLVSQDNSLIAITPSIFSIITDENIIRPFEAEYDSEDNLWIADSAKGLIKFNGNGTEVLIPNGPFVSKVRKLVYGNEQLLAVSGNTLSREQGYSVFSNGGWKNFNVFEGTNNPIPPVRNFSSASFNSANLSWYLGSLQDGLLVKHQDNTYELFNYSNSPLNPSQTTEGNTSIVDLTTDWEGKLWVVNNDVFPGESSLHSLSTEGWKSFMLDHPYSNSALQILLDFAGNKWLRINPALDNSGILVFNEESGKTKHLNSRIGEGGLFNSKVNDMAIDKSGYVWTATNSGISVFYSALGIFDGGDAIRPIFENQYLLKDNKVLAIAIDGGDRKWIGTETGGVWLFNEDASELILHFTTENSPLPSNRVLDIAIHEKSGEIFIATDKGVVSFRADANEGESGFSNVKIFPNPILPDFKGIVGVTGLSDNTIVKITDISGKLIFQTISSGGTASWDLSRSKVRTGVYFVFAVSENGEENMISKVAVIE